MWAMNVSHKGIHTHTQILEVQTLDFDPIYSFNKARAQNNHGNKKFQMHYYRFIFRWSSMQYARQL